MTSTILFSGKIQFEKTGNPLPNVRIELQRDYAAPKWMGGTQTDSNGCFYIYLPEKEILSVQQQHTKAFVNILKDDTLIYCGDITDLSAQQHISIHTGF
ncbi:transthyretin-like family protein [Taibaiella soli]|nr:hypothetical protein [Taibaiella soli]